MRNYEEIFSKRKKLIWDKSQDLLGLDFDQIKKQLSLMKKRILLNINNQYRYQTPLETSREDDYTLNPFLKRTEAHNQIKSK